MKTSSSVELVLLLNLTPGYAACFSCSNFQHYELIIFITGHCCHQLKINKHHLVAHFAYAYKTVV